MLTQAIKAIAPCAATDPSYASSLYVHFRRNAGVLRIEAYDHYRLARIELDNPGKDLDCIVLASQLKKLRGDTNTLAADDDFVYIGGQRFGRDPYTYPDLDRYMPWEGLGHFRVRRADLRAIPRKRPVRVYIGRETLRIRADDYECEAPIAGNTLDEELRLAINGRYLHDMLEAFRLLDVDEIDVRPSYPLSPVTFRPANDELRYVQLVQPMLIDWRQ